jgi:hypothetical protein
VPFAFGLAFFGSPLNVKRVLIACLVVALALSGVTVMLLPRRSAPAAPERFRLPWPVVRGAYHVHSRLSDGTGTLDEIAAAAAKASLQFVIVTDHGDGTRTPSAPEYRAGVLCLDGVEISTELGHLAVLGLPPTPYPLGGHPREVLEDVHRFGGFAIAAHPGSPKTELRWMDWEAPIDGLEWLNADSEWRDEFLGNLGRSLLTYAFRPTETLASLLDRPASVLKAWDRLQRTRRVPALAGADAHARLGFGQPREPYDNRVLARVPSYEVSFRAFVNHVILDAQLTGDAAVDAERILAAVREGRVFTSVDGEAGLAQFQVFATSGTRIARVGDYLDVEGNAAVVAQISAPDGTRLVLLKDGEPIYDAVSPEIRVDVGSQPGAYRVEAFLPVNLATSSVPWVLSNPIYVGLRDAHANAVVPATVPPVSSRTVLATTEWRTEASEGSTSVLTADAIDGGMPALKWQFSLAAGARGRQFAALSLPVARGLADQDRIQVRLKSDGERRLWAQLRAPLEQQGSERWGRTFHTVRTLTSLDLRFADFRRIDIPATGPAPLDRVDSILLVVDTLNSLPGTAGTIWISDLWLAR